MCFFLYGCFQGFASKFILVHLFCFQMRFSNADAYAIYWRRAMDGCGAAALYVHYTMYRTDGRRWLWPLRTVTLTACVCSWMAGPRKRQRTMCVTYEVFVWFLCFPHFEACSWLSTWSYFEWFSLFSKHRWPIIQCDMWLLFLALESEFSFIFPVSFFNLKKSFLNSLNSLILWISSPSLNIFLSLCLVLVGRLRHITQDGRTALIQAAEWGQTECLRLLVEAGVNKDVQKIVR